MTIKTQHNMQTMFQKIYFYHQGYEIIHYQLFLSFTKYFTPSITTVDYSMVI